MSAKLSSPLSSFLFLFGCLPVIVHDPAEASCTESQVARSPASVNSEAVVFFSSLPVFVR